uniref:Uncharacterized protein n=1 Tax=Romanomermis culicivorax TaxID=13658 RepID=A0A915JBE9_ROMCU
MAPYGRHRALDASGHVANCRP